MKLLESELCFYLQELYSLDELWVNFNLFNVNEFHFWLLVDEIDKGAQIIYVSILKSKLRMIFCSQFVQITISNS